MVIADPKMAIDRKTILPEEKYNATNFLTLWNFEGIFRYSPLFYGWYTNQATTRIGYRLPFAYFVTGLVLYAYSFFAILRKMAQNSRLSKLSEKDDEFIFSWKLFTAWDYMIGNAETAHNRIASIIMGFKEALLEEAEKKRESRNWKLICVRILVNTLVVALLSFSAYAVVFVVERSKESDENSSVWRQNETTVVMSLISLLFPMLFEVLGFLEHYHPRKQLRMQLARIMVMNLLNLYSLIFALFDKIEDMTNLTKNLTDLITSTTTAPNRSCLKTCTVYRGDDNFTEYFGTQTNNGTLIAYSLISEVLENYTSYNLNYTTGDSLYNFTASPTNLTDFYENSSLPYETNGIESFADYLSYILSGVSTNFTETFWNDSETNSTSYSSTTSVMPYSMNIRTESDLDERFDNGPTTAFEEITTTTTTTMIPFINCTSICNRTTPIEIPMDYVTRSRLRNTCWETMFGQELIKLTVMDLVMTIISTLAMDFFRGIFVRVMNRCWCWDLEKKFPQYGDFKVAENILHLVNNQGMVWMGMFFSPGLVALNVVKLYVLMYFRAWAVLTCNVPPEIIFRASRSNNFYYALLLMMLFLCVLPVGHAIVWIKPSIHCGPFSSYKTIANILSNTIGDTMPTMVKKALNYIASPGIVIPLLLLLVLVIYYLVSLTGALREANEDLKIQLRRERTEERRKMFQIVDRRRKGVTDELSSTPFAKWRKLLGTMPMKSFDDTPRQQSNEYTEDDKIEVVKPKDFFAKLIKKALGKPSVSEDDNPVDDGTDTEQHDSLPEDGRPQIHRTWSRTSGNYDFQKVASNLMRKESESNQGRLEDIRKYHDMKKPKDFRQDSSCSVWSDNIPVITISKTESVENMLDDEQTDKHEMGENQKFRPKIKYALKKQSTEIDEGMIFHFNKDVEQVVRPIGFTPVSEEAYVTHDNGTKDSNDKAMLAKTELTSKSGDPKTSF